MYHLTSFETFRSFPSHPTTHNNDQCPGLPGKNIRKNPVQPNFPTPFVLFYGLKLTEPRYCVTRIAILASYFLRTAERLLRPLSTARDAEAPDGLPYRCLLSGFYQTGLDRPTFSWELLSNLFGLFEEMTFLAAHAGGHPPVCPHRAGLILSKKNASGPR